MCVCGGGAAPLGFASGIQAGPGRLVNGPRAGGARPRRAGRPRPGRAGLPGQPSYGVAIPATRVPASAGGQVRVEGCRANRAGWRAGSRRRLPPVPTIALLEQLAGSSSRALSTCLLARARDISTGEFCQWRLLAQAIIGPRVFWPRRLLVPATADLVFRAVGPVAGHGGAGPLLLGGRCTPATRT